jgi:hypothetical protein
VTGAPALFAHALRLHRLTPDAPLPDDGNPLPDEDDHRRRPRPTRDRRLRGVAAAEVIDRHFATNAPPTALAAAVRDVYVPIHRDDHLTAAALRADPRRARDTGRWLVRHGTDRGAVLVGLTLLDTGPAAGDIPLIQTIGLLSEVFGPLAASALRRRPGGEQALLWLVRRVAGWGRVYVVAALCAVGGSASRHWLLRHGCDGDVLNGYYAGTVAMATDLHEAIAGAGVDDAVVDHAGQVLKVIAGCEGMGMTLATYPHATEALAAHVGHLGRQEPAAHRYVAAALIAYGLVESRDAVVSRYVAVLDRQDWRATARGRLTPYAGFDAWFRRTVVPRLGLSPAE